MDGTNTIPLVAGEVSRGEVKEEGNLLVEAVSLLVQRQRETESWVKEQVWQAEERAAATERRYAELEARLKDIEDQLTRLAQEVGEPGRGDAGADERLARLREQLEGLKAGADGRPVRSAPGSPIAAGPPPADDEAAAHEAESPRGVASETRPSPGREARRESRGSPGGGEPRGDSILPIPPEWRSRSARPAAYPPARGGARPRQSSTFMDLLGSTAQDRVGVVFIGVGLVAVIYAALNVLRVG
jgi:hypothetical protein